MNNTINSNYTRVNTDIEFQSKKKFSNVSEGGVQINKKILKKFEENHVYKRINNSDRYKDITHQIATAAVGAISWSVATLFYQILSYSSYKNYLHRCRGMTYEYCQNGEASEVIIRTFKPEANHIPNKDTLELTHIFRCSPIPEYIVPITLTMGALVAMLYYYKGRTKKYMCQEVEVKGAIPFLGICTSGDMPRKIK